MKAFVTGASGFLGSHLVELLIREGVTVAALLRPETNPWRIRNVLAEVHPVSGDLGHLEKCRSEIAAFAPEVVFHLGWFGVGSAYRNDSRQTQENLQGTLTLARMASELGCRAFIGLGSQAEYGPCEGAIDETTPTNPTTLYGAAKLAAYHLCRVTLERSNVRFAWARLFSCYGPKDNPQWLIPSLIGALLEGRRPALTRGEQLWDYVYVTDAARALYLLGACQQARGLFNLGSGEAAPLHRIVEQVRNVISPSLPLGFGEIPYRPDQVMHLEANIAKLSQATGWKPAVDLAQGIRDTVQWFGFDPLARERAA